jgi:Lysozyme like domain
MAESSGNQYALSPTDDFGYWQINGSHGPAEATYDPIGNAKAAIAVSGNGSDWLPWTTYVIGAYRGRC